MTNKKIYKLEKSRDANAPAPVPYVTWALARDAEMNVFDVEFRYTNLAQAVVEYFKAHPDTNVLWVTGKDQSRHQFRRRQHYIRWKEAGINLDLDPQESNAIDFNHIDFILADVDQERQRQRWLSEV